MEYQMKTKVNVHEAKTHFSRLLERVQSGEQIIIAKAGKPVAILSPIGDAIARRTPGGDAGKVIIAQDFDAALPEFEER
jgi:prevent-host-death family protein